ncbi:Dam family site-specific DNA-(adenine-N6)-methyltransferase [Desulfovibrio legallii]|uniref:Site-specific DNA-methyltransferase (adenine-specific) n=1 Tax=Desulfovibrio legallii TaxID=571438 RepID=A0A1G7IXK6_9BACT|nr:Dam family site-specific DNA-(adenine-N6)-methyltransferase [Desulfovibrio legallii]SDF17358.1 DNA adenine methylase [Desulfovibrio legallii]
MHVMTTKEAAIKWKISQRRVAKLCSEERIAGATFVGKIWLIPITAAKPEDGRSRRFDAPADMPIKPFLKWAGGKSQVLTDIRKQYPLELGKRITKYAEPFVGGGAVLFDVITNYKIQEAYISDINASLITTYKTIRDNVTDIIKHLQEFEASYLPASSALRKKQYYGLRDRFNAIKSMACSPVELAALFIFLNKTCFNGLYRVNSKGCFNVPQGSYKNPKICDAANLKAASEALQKVTIVCADYKKSRDVIDSNTFVYFDPPYRPLSATARFTSYAEGGFGDNEQIELAQFIDAMSERGAHIVASNSDPKNTNATDDFFDRLYSKHKVLRIGASRAINSVGTSRNKISELLICNA